MQSRDEEEHYSEILGVDDVSPAQKRADKIIKDFQEKAQREKEIEEARKLYWKDVSGWYEQDNNAASPLEADLDDIHEDASGKPF